MSLKSPKSSTDLASLSKRMDSLESQLAFQEDIIESLNQLVSDQNLNIQRLQKHLGVLAEKVQQHDSNIEEQPTDERPPHY